MGKLIILIFIAVSAFSGSILANGNQAPELVLNFFIETEKDQGNKLSFPWNTSIGEKHFRRGAAFKTQDVAAQRPFPSPHNDLEYGMIFQLTPDARRRLSFMTANNNGKYMIVFLNNKPLDMVKIDKKIDDGIICVWRGLSTAEVHKADELTHRVGETKAQWKKRLKDKSKK